MKLDIKIGERIAEVHLIERTQEWVTLSIDGKIMKMDLRKVEANTYSIIHEYQSHDVEIFDGLKPKEYRVKTDFDCFGVQIIDAEAKYQMARGKGVAGEDANAISSPMPGKVVRVLVNEGDLVSAGDTVVVVSAMKMESEYKVKQDRKIVKVCVKEGDNIEAHQALVIVE
jgi:biotin carboxyl carrier protein